VSWIDEISTTEWVIGAGLIGGALALALGETKKDGLFAPAAPRRCGFVGPEPEQFRGVPFAQGGACPIWPLSSRRERIVSYRSVTGSAIGNWARRFGADRDSRYHAGIDLYANVGDPVLAMEKGTVTAMRTFFHGAWSLYLCTDSGITINYGEIARNSWRDYGISPGSRVETGQPLAKIALMSGGSYMLHFETYAGCVTRNYPWYKSRGAPSALLNPTKYLLRARDQIPG